MKPEVALEQLEIPKPPKKVLDMMPSTRSESRTEDTSGLTTTTARSAKYIA